MCRLDRFAEHDMKLIDIDSDTLGIPDTEYETCGTSVTAGEFGLIHLQPSIAPSSSIHDGTYSSCSPGP